MHSWLCHRPWWATPTIQTQHCQCSMLIQTSADSQWLLALEFQDWKPMFMSRLNSSVWHNPPRDYLIIPWTIWNACTSGNPFSHSLTSRQSLHCKPSFPCLNVGTSNSKSDSWLVQPPPLPNHCWWWTRIWNLWNPRLQDWQLILCLQAIVTCLLDRVWGHWWRNFLDPHFWAQTCFQTCCRFPLCISSQAWSPFSLWIRHISVLKFYLKSSHFLQVNQSIYYSTLS